MSRFRFTLERLLSLRHFFERHQASRLGSALRTAEIERQRCAEAAARHQEADRQIRELAGRGVPAGLWQGLAQVRDAIAGARTRQAAAAAAAESLASDEQRRYAEALRARQSLERLRETRRAAWLEDARRREQRDADEAARLHRRPHEFSP
jgi:flagellar export protein FliJ